MNPISSLSRCCRAFVVLLITLFAAWSAPAAAQTAAPYVFFLLDTSGSMNYSPPCTQTQIDAGECGFLCTTGDCFVSMQGDDPASKLYQLKAGLYDSIAQRDDLLLGFASFNQDTLNVRAKHWLYQATGNGPSVGTWGPFPAAGAQEVFGLAWSCGSGTGNSGVGCTSTNPADLNDPWELARMQRLPKGGLSFNTVITFYVRYAAITYKVLYTPNGTAVPGASVIKTTVNIYKCTNSSCSTSTQIVSSPAVVSWSLVSDFLSWDIDVLRTNPELGYFSQTSASDATAANTCSGWEPNTDTSSDKYPNSTGYSLHWLTDASDPRGFYYTVGDVLPLDWNNNHKLDIEKHLAPNLAVNSAATPDFRIATYLKDLPQSPDTFLRLKTEHYPPLIANGSTPMGASLSSFGTWYSGWQGLAALRDPDWANRHTSVVLLTDDGGEICGGDPCGQASTLYSQYGIRTFVVAFGGQAVAGSTLECTAANGGTTAPYYPQTRQELIDDLALIYAAAANP
jgi:hypothetical protein